MSSPSQPHLEPIPPSIRTAGCRYLVYGGCAIVALAVFLLVVLVAVNFSTIRDFAGRAQEELHGVMAVRNAIIAEYDTGNVGVSKKYSRGQTRLVITLQNAHFLGSDSAERAEQIRDVARFALTHYVKSDDLTHVVIAVANTTGVGLTFTNTKNYSFAVEELIAPEAEESESAEPASPDQQGLLAPDVVIPATGFSTAHA